MFRAVIWKDLARTGTKGAKMPKPKASSEGTAGPMSEHLEAIFSEGSDCNPRYHEDDEVNSEEGRLKEKLPSRGKPWRYMQQCMRLSKKEKAADQDTPNSCVYLWLNMIQFLLVLQYLVTRWSVWKATCFVQTSRFAPHRSAGLILPEWGSLKWPKLPVLPSVHPLRKVHPLNGEIDV